MRDDSVGNNMKEKTKTGRSNSDTVHSFNGRSKFRFCSNCCKIHATTSVYLVASVLYIQHGRLIWCKLVLQMVMMKSIY